MYVIKNLFYGHDLSVDKELNDELWGYDIEYERIIDGFRFEVSVPYHGGQCAGDAMSVFFGTFVTADDCNKNFAKEVRTAKEDNFKKPYREFVNSFLDYLNTMVGEEDFVRKITNFLSTMEPDFYIVESSS